MRLAYAATRLGLLAAFAACSTSAYTVLTHEAVLDAAWNTSIRRLLLKRFPDSTPEQLVKAHAYAYGGCIIQDMGYYPFSSRLFSDLTHYVRSGDFVTALIRESHDVNEYAFALGALEHFVADTVGHHLGTNRAVPILYPKLRRKFGNEISYWDDPVAHVRTEFSFDVLQVARGRYASEGYRDFIGFQVSRELIERAFVDTYGMEMKDIFSNLGLAVGTYRHVVSAIIPAMTRVAWTIKSDQIQKEAPGLTRNKFLYNLSRAGYEKEWGKEYTKPGLGTRFLGWIFRILPATGPFSALKIKTPTPEVDTIFMASFNATLERYTQLLANEEAGRLRLDNENFDVGGRTPVGKYKGTDETYAKLLDKLADHKFEKTRPDLRANILSFYSVLPPEPAGKRSKKEEAERAKLEAQLDRLKAVPSEVAK